MSSGDAPQQNRERARGGLLRVFARNVRAGERVGRVSAVPAGDVHERDGRDGVSRLRSRIFQRRVRIRESNRVSGVPAGVVRRRAGDGELHAVSRGTVSARVGERRVRIVQPGILPPGDKLHGRIRVSPVRPRDVRGRAGDGRVSSVSAGKLLRRAAGEACKLCEAGTVYPFFGGNVSSQCESCPPGRVAPVPGMSECEPCAPGTYNEFDKASECQPCEPGTFLDFAGSKNAEDCQPCPTSPRGTYADRPGTATCAPCPLGTYAEEEGLVECTPVEPGSYLPLHGI